jgi:hypothetical protein
MLEWNIDVSINDNPGLLRISGVLGDHEGNFCVFSPIKLGLAIQKTLFLNTD